MSVDWSTFTAPGPGKWEREREHMRAPGTAIRDYIGSLDESSEAMRLRFKDGDTRGWVLGENSPGRYGTSPGGGGGRRGGGGGGGRRGGGNVVGGVNWSQGGGPSPPLSIDGDTSLAQLQPFIEDILEGRSAFDRRPWAEDLADWDQIIRDDAVAHHHALQSVDVVNLSGDELLEHLEHCYANSVYGSNIHFGLGSVSLGSAFGTPLNDFLASSFEWTGCDARVALDCVAGYSSPTVIGTNAEAIAVARALLACEPALGVVRACGTTDEADAAATIAALEGIGDADVQEKFAAFKMHVGYRLTDSHTGIATAPMLLETPATFIRLLNSVVDHVQACDAAGVPPTTSPVLAVSDAAAGYVRARVPGAKLAEWDVLLGEARSCYKLRDERVNYADAWANGIVRRALLEVGRRVVERGDHDGAPTIALEANHSEVEELVKGTASAATIQALVDLRAARHASTVHFLPPQLIGDEQPAPTPADTSAVDALLSWLPDSVSETMMRMHRLNDVRRFLETPLPPNYPGSTVLSGVGISGGVYEGEALVGVMGIDCMPGEMEPGVIFVTQATSSCFNLVIPSLGGLVCDGGSLLSHPGITAREHGTPCVVAVGGCCSCIRTGDRIRIDPDVGTVEVLERAAHSKL